MTEISKEEKDAQLRRILFVPCTTQKQLHSWIRIFLGIDIPDCIVDPESTSSPMAMIYEAYTKMRLNDDPRFNRVLYYASRDSFKCCEKGTKLLSKSRGLVSIENVLVGEEIWSGSSWRTVTDWIHDGEKESTTLELQNGLRLVVSPIHKVWAWKPNGVPCWHKVSELTEDDIVCVDTSHGYQLHGETNEDEFETGYLCGALQGDGCLTLMDKYNMIVMTASDPVVLDSFKAACLKFAGRLPRNAPPPRGYDWHVVSKEMVAKIKGLGLTCSYSYQKSIPHAALTSSSAMAGFVSGLFDTDGSVGPKKDILFQLTAETMCRELQVLLAALGVNSRFRSNKRLYGIQKHMVHHVIIPQNEIPALLAAGVRLRAKKAQCVTDAKTADAHDGIPVAQFKGVVGECRSRGGKDLKGRVPRPTTSSYKTITRDKALRLGLWALDRGVIDKDSADRLSNALKNRWIGVRSVTSGTADFYDLTVEGDHSYWSGGLISHNTLSAAILELLVVLHLGRDVAHMAAIEAQSHKSQLYVKKFLSRPYLRDFLVGDSQESTWIVRYNNPQTGVDISESQWKHLDNNFKDQYNEIKNYIKVVICTMAGANSDHVPLFVVDEIDVVTNPRAYEEAKMIPAPINGLMPLTLLTSTRKISTGLVQKEIDEAVDQDGNVRLQIRHWNIIDVTEACPPERHLPNEPKIDIYVSESELRAIPLEKYDDLSEESKAKFVKESGYVGCLKNCKLYPACRSRLATLQRSKSKLLKPIDHVINMFVGSNISVQTALAQLLCKKPSTEGLIYPNLDRATHAKTPAQMAEIIVGIPFPSNMSKKELIELMKSRGMLFYSGMDFGFTHNFAVVTIATDGARAFVIDVIAEPELLPDEQVNAVAKLKALDTSIFADPENPQMIAVLRRSGFKMRSWDKAKWSVVGGIDIVRMRLRPPMGEPLLFFLAGDPGVELLLKRISKYHWKVDAAGRISDKPSDTDDDECDALRYAIMNVFTTKGRLKAVAGAGEETIKREPVREAGSYSRENWMKEWLKDHGVTQDEGDGLKMKKGRVLIDM